MRWILSALLAFTVGTTSAHAAPRPLAHLGDVDVMALAGDRAYTETPTGDVISIPTAGGRASTVLPASRDTGTLQISASPLRAALVRATGTSERDRYQLFAGPPFAPLEPPLTVDGAPTVPLRVQVDGDRLFTFRTVAPRTTTVIAREPDPHELAFPPTANAARAVFRGDLVAYPMTWTDRDPRFSDRRLVVASWKTGEPRYVVDLPSVITALDLRPSGRVVATVDRALFDISPTGDARMILAEADSNASFAGEHIVFVRRGSLQVRDPSGQVRRFGIRTNTSIAFATDETRVLWVANNCLLVASVADAPVNTVGPGPCVRGELEIESGGTYRALGRDLPVRLRCVTGRCGGRLRVKLEGRWLSSWQPFSVPARRTRRVQLRLTDAGRRALARAGEAGGFIPLVVEWRSDGGPRVPLYGLTVEPR